MQIKSEEKKRLQAQVIHEFGAPSVFKKAELPRPQVTAGHVLVEVKATSVNPIDCKIRAGLVPDIAPTFPAVLHGDVAGVIAEVGPKVKSWKVGDEIYACAGGVKGRDGALAEQMLVESGCLAHKPKSLSFAEAAALPLVSITAWEALFLKAKIKEGCRLLIHGGVGGVGHIAVQLGKWAGAHVTATVGSEEDLDRVHKLGADRAIHFRGSDYVKRLIEGGGFDVVFDTVGGKNLDLSFQAAALNGIVVTTAARSTNDLSPMHQKALSLHVVFMLLPLLHHLDLKYQGEILEKVAWLVDQRKIAPMIDPERFSMGEIAKAHAYLESGKAKGKVVVG